MVRGSGAAAGLVVAALAGCLAGGPTAEVVQEPAPVGGLFQVDDAGIGAVSEIVGLTVAQGRYTWDAMEKVEGERMSLLLLQATADTPYTLAENHSVHFVGQPDSLAEQRETACAAILAGPGILEPIDPVAGDYYLARAQGLEATPPEELPNHDLAFVALYGVGISAPGLYQGGGEGWSETNGTLRSGEWMVWGGGISGMPALATDTKSTLLFDLEVQAPLLVYELPSVPLHCGMGFSALQNATFHTGPPGIHVGGGIAMPGVHGETFLWMDTCWPADGPNPVNQAQIAFDGSETTLTQATLWLMLGTYGTSPAVLSVDQWRGYPMWMLLGFPLEPFDLQPLELIGCLR